MSGIVAIAEILDRILKSACYGHHDATVDLSPSGLHAESPNASGMVGDILELLEDQLAATIRVTEDETSKHLRVCLAQLQALRKNLWRAIVLDDPASGCSKLALMDHTAISSQRVCILSSHVGRRPDEWTDWWDAFRESLEAISAKPTVLMTARGATVDRYLRAIGPELDTRLTHVETATPGQTMGQWFERHLLSKRDDMRLGSPSESRCLVSPGFHRSLLAKSCAEQNNDRPTSADATLLCLCDEAYVLYTREKGRLSRILNTFAERPYRRLDGVKLEPREHFIPTQLRRDWEFVGACVRSTSGDHKPDGASQPAIRHGPFGMTGSSEVTIKASTQSRLPTKLPVFDVIPQECEQNGRFLCHWTRACSGPWPDQTETDFVLEMLHEPESRRRTALDALRRILQMECVLGTHRLIRGGTPVVCFTERKLSEFSHYRVFRPHLTRWDFMPYGLCIARESLIELGTRPAIYGHNTMWSQLPCELRPYFQKGNEVNAVQSVAVDWTIEKEWRLVGNLCLNSIPAERCYVFVPDAESAEQIVPWSRWPVIVLPT